MNEQVRDRDFQAAHRAQKLRGMQDHQNGQQVSNLA